MTDADLIAGVELLLSELLGGSVEHGSHLSRMVAAWSGIRPVSFEGGRSGWPTPEYSLDACGLNRRQFRSLQHKHRRKKLPLPRHMTSPFFPDVLWLELGRKVELGPEEFTLACEDVLEAWVEGVELDDSPHVIRWRQDGSPGKTGAISSGSLTVYLWTIRAFLAVCESLAGKHPMFDAWTEATKTPVRSSKDYDALAARWDRSAPAIPYVRLTLRDLDSQVKTRRLAGCDSFTVIRDRAMLALECLLGPRRSDYGILVVGDILPSHGFRCDDGQVEPAPAVRLRPLKELERRVTRYKAVPSELYLWIVEYLTFCEKYFGIPLREMPQAPLWLPNKRERGRELNALTPGAISKALERRIQKFAGRAFSIHTLRHFASQLATLAGEDWLHDHREQRIRFRSSGVPTVPEHFALFLLDQALSNLSARYNDLDTEPNRERFGRIAVTGAWEYLWGDKGAPTGPDIDGIERARADLARASQRLAEAEATSNAARFERARLLADADRLAGDLTEVERFRVLVRLSDAEPLSQAAIEVERAKTDHEAAERALSAAFDRRVPIPDEDEGRVAVPSEWTLTKPSTPHAQHTTKEVRILIFPREFQWALGGPDVLPTSTLRRWMTGQLRYKGDDPRNVFRQPPEPGGRPPEIVWMSPRRQMIDTTKLDRTRYPRAVLDRLDFLTTITESESNRLLSERAAA